MYCLAIPLFLDRWTQKFILRYSSFQLKIKSTFRPMKHLHLFFNLFHLGSLISVIVFIASIFMLFLCAWSHVRAILSSFLVSSETTCMLFCSKHASRQLWRYRPHFCYCCSAPLDSSCSNWARIIYTFCSWRKQIGAGRRRFLAIFACGNHISCWCWMLTWESLRIAMKSRKVRKTNEKVFWTIFIFWFPN